MTQEEPIKIEGVEKVAEFIELAKFNALPKESRIKQYGFYRMQDFSIRYNLNDSTIASWRNKDVFWQYVKRFMFNWGQKQTPDVLRALLKRIKEEGRRPETELWLQLFQGFEDTRRLKVDADIKREMTEEEKQLIRESLKHVGIGK